jgi:hypothetical protein
MSLRGEPIEQVATLEDGARVLVRIGVPDDPYVERKDLNLVDVQIFAGDRSLAAVTTSLSPEQTSEARRLARTIVSALESGRAELSASAIERLVYD